MGQARIGHLRIQELPSGRYAELGHNNIVHRVTGNLLGLRSGHMAWIYLFDNSTTETGSKMIWFTDVYP